MRTQALPEEVGVESALPPIQIPTQDAAAATNAAKSASPARAKSKSPRVRFSKRVGVRTFEKSSRDIIGDAVAEMKPNDT